MVPLVNWSLVPFAGAKLHRPPQRTTHFAVKTSHRHFTTLLHADPGHQQDGAAFTFTLAATHPHRYFVVTLAQLIGGSC